MAESEPRFPGCETAADRAAYERTEQGLPVLIDDPLAYRDLRTLLRPTPKVRGERASAPASPAPSVVGEPGDLSGTAA